VLAAMGLTVSDAVRLVLTRVAREHALPFAPLIPNPAKVSAMMGAGRQFASGEKHRRTQDRASCGRLNGPGNSNRITGVRPEVATGPSSMGHCSRSSIRRRMICHFNPLLSGSPRVCRQEVFDI
jgi:addiction module RelB/DinJ family antitoxin